MKTANKELHDEIKKALTSLLGDATFSNNVINALGFTTSTSKYILNQALYHRFYLSFMDRGKQIKQTLSECTLIRCHSDQGFPLVKTFILMSFLGDVCAIGPNFKIHTVLNNQYRSQR